MKSALTRGGSSFQLGDSHFAHPVFLELAGHRDRELVDGSIEIGYPIGSEIAILKTRSQGMVARLTPQLEARIADLVASGNYADPGDVIDTAVSLLEVRERKLAWLRAELAIGEAQEQRGEFAELTPERLEAIKRQARENMRNGKPVRDAVKP
jgi:putative addiction module CopG family antidote